MAFRLRNPNNTFVTVDIGGGYAATIPAQGTIGPFGEDHLTDDIRRMVTRGILLRLDEPGIVEPVVPDITVPDPFTTSYRVPASEDIEDNDASEHDNEDMTGGSNE